MSKKEMQIALTGNPNSGKTSTFNALTGSLQYVGNWPGVTVERKSGKLKKDKEITIQDLPGIYSLSPYSPEEVVTRDYMLSGQPDGILNIIDGSNIERNLYLTTQLMEIGLPMVLAINMMDIVEKSGKRINLDKLAYGLGIEVVGMSALKKQGLDQGVQKMITAIQGAQKPLFPSYDERVEAALTEMIDVLGNTVPEKQARYYAIKLFEKDPLAIEQLELSKIQQKDIAEIIAITEKLFDDTSDAILINERYEFIGRLMTLCMTQEGDLRLSISDRIDQVVTNRILALPIFAFAMWGVYYLSIQTVGVMGTDWVNDVLFGELVPNHVAGWLAAGNVAPWMQDLLLNGIISGVGAVLGFLPQLLVLFLCLSLLEDCGYMSRIAFVMDRIFRKFGLSGKSFIPMLVATGCGVPGVMASRTIENEKDRRMTAMITTFMPCSAKLPIIALIAGAFFPNASWVAPSAYFLGVAAIVLSGIALKKTKLFAGDPAPFIMELPAYHLPQLQGVLHQVADRGLSFIKNAATIIFVSSIIIWFTSTHSWTLQAVGEENSILAGFGRLIAPLFAPLGWGNWRETVAAITGLVAKENVIGTFGVLYSGMDQVAENGVEIWGPLRATLTPVAAYSFLTFNLLCAPCFASIAAIHREMGALKWTLRAVAYQCGLAFGVSLMIYQFGHLIFENGQFNVGTVAALAVLGFMLWSLTRKVKVKSSADFVLTMPEVIAKEGAK